MRCIPCVIIIDVHFNTFLATIRGSVYLTFPLSVAPLEWNLGVWGRLILPSQYFFIFNIHFSFCLLLIWAARNLLDFVEKSEVQKVQPLVLIVVKPMVSACGYCF